MPNNEATAVGKEAGRRGHNAVAANRGYPVSRPLQRETERAVPCLGCLKSALASRSAGDCLDSPSARIPGRCVRCSDGKRPCEPIPQHLEDKAVEFILARQQNDVKTAKPLRTDLKTALGPKDKESDYVPGENDNESEYMPGENESDEHAQEESDDEEYEQEESATEEHMEEDDRQADGQETDMGEVSEDGNGDAEDHIAPISDAAKREFLLSHFELIVNLLCPKPASKRKN